MTAKRFRTRTRKAWTKLKKAAALFAKGFWSLRTLICALGSLLILLLFMVAIVPVRYNLTIGSVPTHTITANRDVVDEITTEQLRRSAAAAVTPTYYYADGATEEVLTAFEKLCDDALMAQAARARRVPFGVEVVIGFVAAREAELSNVRIIMTGRMAGIPADTIRERLRESYV